MVKKAYKSVLSRSKGIWQDELAIPFALRFANKRRDTFYGLTAARRLDRCPNVVRFRMELCWALRNLCGWSYPRIGALLDRDHSSIIYLCAKFEGGPLYKRHNAQARGRYHAHMMRTQHVQLEAAA